MLINTKNKEVQTFIKQTLRSSLKKETSKSELLEKLINGKIKLDIERVRGTIPKSDLLNTFPM